jgi:SAM-dependent methyltransferase
MIEHKLSQIAREDDRILDVGTKDGTKVDDIPGEVIGLDLKLNPDTNEIEFVKADGCKMPFRTASFDYVVSQHVLEHLPFKRELISEMARVLKPDGTLFISFPNRYSIQTPHDSTRWYYSILPKKLAVRLAYQQFDDASAQAFETGTFPVSPFEARSYLEQYFEDVEYSIMKHKQIAKDTYAGTSEGAEPQTQWAPYVAHIVPMLRWSERQPVIGRLLEMGWPNAAYECRTPI